VHPIPLVRAGLFAHFVHAAAEIDNRLIDGLERVRFSPDVLDDHEALLPFEQCLAYIHVAARRCGLADFGFVVGKRRHIADLGVFGELVRHSLSLHEAIATACAIFPGLNTGARLTFEHHGSEAWLRHRLVRAGTPGGEQVLLYALPMLVDLVRLAGGGNWLPRKGTLPPGAIAALKDRGLREAMRPADGSEVAIAIDTILLSMPLHLTNDNGLREKPQPVRAAGDEDPGRSYVVAGPSASLLGSLEQALAPLLRSNHANLETLAEIAHVSARTLQRALEREGATFSRLMERARFHKAHALLTTTDMKLIAIAYELGYHEPASFSRAFHRWTGVSPSDYRMQRR
jgi:AraC-like DNA-binding protein